VYTAYAAATGIYLIVRDGIYEFSSQITITHDNDATHFDAVDSGIQILVNSTAAAVNYGESVTQGITQFKVSTGPISLNKGDEVKVQIINGTAKTVTVKPTVGWSYFNGKQID